MKLKSKKILQMMAASVVVLQLCSCAMLDGPSLKACANASKVYSNLDQYSDSRRYLLENGQDCTPYYQGEVNAS